ncbi:MAG TPA: FHA domain-containing protein [Polyangia bacterium]|nr:FHA domain-containing protein [Polyangia bacterium]
MTTRRRRPGAATAAAIGLGIWAVGWAAHAGPALITTRPVVDAETDELTFFVGGFNDAGRSLKASSVDLLIDGQRSDAVPVIQTLSDWSTTSAEGSKTWRPPLSLGLVYLWIEHVPPGVLDGIQAFFQRVPSRTVVYPTVYGRMRQGRARLTAADVSRLGDVPYIEGYRPNLIEAVKLDLADLAADPSPLRVLLIVTDGRDFADPKGEGPGDFAALGRDIRRAGVTPLVVAFPAPDADRAQAAANLNELHDAAGGVLRLLDQPQDLENALESLGQGMADLLRVHLPTPYGWHVFGGSHHLSVRLNVGGGQRLNADMGAVTVGPGKLRSVVLGVAGVLALVAGVAIFVLRRRGAGGGPAGDDEILQAAHDLIRRGASPRRAVEELTRNYPEAVSELITMDQDLFSDPRFPYFRTRPGRLRMQEIRDLLAKKSVDSPVLDDTLAAILADAVANRTPPDQAAAMLAARVGADECNSFTSLGLDRLAEALRAAAHQHPTLGTPRARGAVVAIQDTLKTRGGAQGILVAWLVRAGGSGRRGETLRLGDGRTVIGLAQGCAIRLSQDPTVASEHAEVTLEGSEFAISPLGGPVTVEGSAVDRRRVLTDGETIGIGDGLFIFKSATAGNLSSSEPTAGRGTRPAVARRR